MANRALTGLLILVLLLSTSALRSQDIVSGARQELEAGNPAKAIGMLESYRQQNPSEPAACNLLGIAYAESGDGERSLAVFKECARLAPAGREAYNNLGTAYLRQGDAANAEDSFRRALALGPDNPSTLYNLGALLNARHDYSKARPLLQRALQRDRSAGIIYELAVATAGVGDRKEALQVLGLTAPPPGIEGLPWLRLLGTLNLDEGHLPQAVKVLEQAVVLAPDDSLSLYSLGVAQLRSNRAAEAIPILEKSLASQPAVQSHLRIGTLLAAHGDTTEALTQFERAAAEDPSSYDAQYNIAVLRLERKNIDGAAQAAERALALKPSGEVHDVLGEIYEAQGRYADALVHSQDATRLEPNNEKFIFDLGVELILHENYDAAQGVFRAASSTLPRSALVWLGLGTATFLGGRNEEATESLLRAVALAPDLEPAVALLGEAYSFSSTHKSRVVAELSQVAETRPRSFAAQYYYGAALVKEMSHTGVSSDSQAAQTALHRAVSLRPDDGRTYYQLGEIERLLGHSSEAVQFYNKALSLKPDFPEALYKLGQMYLRLGRQADADRVLARHRQVMAQDIETDDRRSNEVVSFVLKIRQPASVQATSKQ
jgi:tetratricopeptide (TPR) repeat protein